jgi:hypothetical protein
MSALNQFENDRENEFVGSDERDLPPDDEQDGRFDALLEREAARQAHEEAKRKLERALLALGAFSPSLCDVNVRHDS